MVLPGVTTGVVGVVVAGGGFEASQKSVYKGSFLLLPRGTQGIVVVDLGPTGTVCRRGRGSRARDFPYVGI